METEIMPIFRIHMLFLLSVFTLASCASIDPGHRLGYESNECKDFPENSIEVFQCAIRNKLYSRYNFDYFELDVQETFKNTFSKEDIVGDCSFVVFHNQSKFNTFSDLVPIKLADNRKYYTEALAMAKSRGFKVDSRADLKIKHLTLREIQQFKATNNKDFTYRIPTIQKILDVAVDELPTDKKNVKIMVEIKRINTEICRDTLLTLLEVYNNKHNLNIDLLVRLSKKTKKSYSKYLKEKVNKPSMINKLVGGINQWCPELDKHKLFISSTGKNKYDLCRDKKISSIQS